jgi:hypothetical protein
VDATLRPARRAPARMHVRQGPPPWRAARSTRKGP